MINIVDITERKTIESQLTQDKEFIQNILNASPDLIYVYDIETVSIAYANDNIKKYFGYSDEEIRAMGSDLVQYLMHPDDIPHYKNMLLPKLREMKNNEVFQHTYRLKTRNGQWRWFFIREKIFSRKPDGSPKQIFGLLVDASEQREAEETRKHNEERFQLAFENIMDVVTVYDSKRRIKYINEATFKITNLPPSFYIGKQDEDIWPPEVYRTYLPTLKEVYKTGKSRSVETYIKFPDGKKRFLHISCIPVIDNNGDIQEVIGITQDFTEQEKSKNLLKESEERYRLLVEKSPFAIGVIQDGKIIYANPGAGYIFGTKSPDEIIGKPISSFIFSENLAKTLKRIQQLLAGKNISYPVEDRFVRLDGTDFPVEVTESPLIYHGKPSIQLIAQDITDKTKALEELENEAVRRRILIENSRDGIVVLDENGDVFEANIKAAEMLGYTPDEYAKLSVFDWDARFSKENLRNMINMVDKSGDFFETKHHRKDGSEMDVEISSSASMFKGKKLIFCVIRDITERKKAEKKLEQTLTQLRHAVAATISTLMQAIEIRDPYTAGHQRRVADLARSIAEEIHLPSEQIEGIRIAASIHDIGKISIPSEILSKPSSLSDMEMALVREHVNYGYNILRDIESVWPLAEIVHQHHERMDGTGYPQGLKGDQIMIEARILAVADVVEAMASHRPYRPARGVDAALQEIEDKKGTFFDEQVVDACTRLFREKGFEFK